jgi:hypothetical protein
MFCEASPASSGSILAGSYHRGGPYVTAELIARVRQEQSKNQLELVRSEIDEELSEFINHDVLGWPFVFKTSWIQAVLSSFT